MENNHINTLIESENIGILSVTTGQLDIAKIPITHAPDWIVPQALILAIEPQQQRVSNYSWHGQDIAVYPLIDDSVTPSHIIVLESVTDAHRIGLQIKGALSYQSVRIADIRDAAEHDYRQALANLYSDSDNKQDLLIGDTDNDRSQSLIYQPDFVFQPVIFNGEICVIPDLDNLSQFLVDSDS